MGIEQLILDFINNVYLSIGWVGVVILMMIESACIPLPSELIMPLAGWMLIANQNLGIGFVLLAGFCGGLGNLLGSLIAYWVGAYGGLPFLKRYGKYVLISNHDLDLASYWFDKHGDWITLGARFLPAIRTFISFPAGIARMNLGKFSLYAFLGSFVWSAALAYGGYVLGQNWEKIREVMRPFDYPIIAVCVILIIFFIWYKVRKNKTDQQ